MRNGLKAITFNKLKSFYLGKYFYNLISRDQRFYFSYLYNRKTIWYRNAKVGTRTINDVFLSLGNEEYFYGSPVILRARQLRKYYKFAFVRNPVERFLSAWRDKVKRLNYFEFDDDTYEKMQDLDQFIDWVAGLDIRSCDEHIRLQCAIVNINELDFLGRMEHFEKDFRNVLNQIGLSHKEFKRLNSTKKRKERTLEQKKRIARIYEQDIRVFYPELIYLLDEDDDT